MDFAALLDPASAAIVVGGTVVATLVGSGRGELAAGVEATAQLFHRPFNYEHARAEIARDVEAMRTDGVVRARTMHSTDREILSATEALIHDRSLASLIATHEKFRDDRAQRRGLALRPVLLAAEMGPVFGMVGTLISLSQMTQSAPAAGSMIGGIALAVLTTLYGLILAHLACNPLARLIARRGADEEAQRQLLIDWLARQLAAACPPGARPDTSRPAAPVLGRVA